MAGEFTAEAQAGSVVSLCIPRSLISGIDVPTIIG